jgi:hypothetical protein
LAGVAQHFVWADAIAAFEAAAFGADVVGHFVVLLLFLAEMF